jgi:ABC-type lipoprotein export system ATPase subunit
MSIFHKKNVMEVSERQEPVKNDQPIIQMKNVVKKFKTEAGLFTALNGINMDFYQGEFIGVTGKSGSGKSTLANMITGIDHPTSGDVIINGIDVLKLNESEMARWRGKNLGIVFQFYQLLPMLTLLENVMLPMDFGDVYDPMERENRAMELLSMVGLEGYAHKMPAAVSGGQQQTAAIARALANDPPLIIADEPTGNLDSRTAAHVFEVFERLAEQGKTIIMVTHDPALAKRTSRQIVISDGEIIDEWVIKALPQLSHSQMLELTQQLILQDYQPGEIIIRQNEPNEIFHIVKKGEVEVAIKDKDGKGLTITTLHDGDFFGEIEIMEKKPAIAEVRAARSEPVEILAIKGDVLDGILSESKSMHESLLQTVQKRLTENLSACKQMKKENAKGGRIAQTSLA